MNSSLNFGMWTTLTMVKFPFGGTMGFMLVIPSSSRHVVAEASIAHFF